MRFRLIPVLAACAIAAAIYPLTASAQPRMLIGFQDDPSLRWRDDRLQVFDMAQSANAGIVRTTVYWSRIAETRPTNAINPFDPELPLRRPRRVRPQRRAARDGGHADDLGHATLGERRQGAELRTDEDEPTSRTSRERSRPATRAVTRATRSCATSRSGTSRISASSCRRSTPRTASRSHPRSTRSCTAPPTPGSRSATRARSSGSARPPRAAATTSSASRGRRRRSHPASSRSSSRSSGRRSSSTPGRTIRTRRRPTRSRHRWSGGRT